MTQHTETDFGLSRRRKHQSKVGEKVKLECRSRSVILDRSQGQDCTIYTKIPIVELVFAQWRRRE